MSDYGTPDSEIDEGGDIDEDLSNQPIKEQDE